jgi:hypothetical protein
MPRNENPIVRMIFGALLVAFVGGCVYKSREVSTSIGAHANVLDFLKW